MRIQPQRSIRGSAWDVIGRRKRWEFPETNAPAISTHAFSWRGVVEFLSLAGHNMAPAKQAANRNPGHFRGREYYAW